MKKAIITGVTGQDGSYLSELLLEKGYEVHGVIRRASTFNTIRIDHLRSNKNFNLHHGDLTDSSNLHSLISSIMPNEIYNLAAQSHVAVSFETPEYTAQVDGLGVLSLLNAIRYIKPDIKLYQASTSELFGGMKDTCPQSELTPFYPRSPYAVAKQFAYWSIINYREAYNLFATNGILFNHESPRRSETFVTKKITKAFAKMVKGSNDPLLLGNLYSTRDWGYAKDYVYGMWMMLQDSIPDDYVLATGKTITIKSFVNMVAKEAGYDIVWEGEKENEFAYHRNSGKILVKIDPKYYRPTECDYLQGDYTKAKNSLGWEPTVTVEELAHKMFLYDYNYDTFGHEEL